MVWVLKLTRILVGIIGILGIYVARKRRQKIDPMSAGMTIGGIAGMVNGVALVELWGYDYPLPFVTWMLGMAAGTIAGLLYKRKE